MTDKKKTFDPKKPVQTRDGRPARIICADSKNIKGSGCYARAFPIVAIIQAHPNTASSVEMVIEYREDGKANISDDAKEVPYDLVNAPEKKIETRKIVRNHCRPNELGHFATVAAVCTTPRGENIGYLDFHSEDGELVDVVFRKKESGL